jgi:hypothetical protein
MKKLDIKHLRKKLWIVLTAYIKKRDGRKCITCGKDILPGKGLHSGHFIPSKICGVELRYDEYNVHVQCFFCNRNMGGFGAMYYIKMIEKYGQERVDELFRRYNVHLIRKEKWSEEDYIAKINYYENKIKTL